MVLGMSDKLRSSAQEVVRILDELSIETVMLTGDGNGAASYMSKSIGINEVLSSMKPGDKLQWIKDRQVTTYFLCKIFSTSLTLKVCLLGIS